MLIYKIVPQSLWAEALTRGVFIGAAVDIADGFIHFSTAAQVEETARKHFRGQSDLLLLAFEDRDLGEGLHYEPSRNGELFPHLYDTLDVNLVRSTKALVMNADGTHRFTGLLL